MSDMNEAMMKMLTRPFDANKVKQKCGQGNRTMSYISHGLVTERLNDADPNWSWRPIQTYTYQGADGRLHCEGVEVELTVGGVSRVEAGGPQRQDGFANEIKNAYSDALKRAAMRFGVALHMWETLVDAEGDEDYDDEPAPPRNQNRPAQANVAAARPTPAPATNGNRIAYNDPRQTATYEPQKALREEVAARKADSTPVGWNEVWSFAKAMGIQGRAALDEAIAPTVVDDTALWQVLARLKEIKAERMKQFASHAG